MRWGAGGMAAGVGASTGGSGPGRARTSSDAVAAPAEVMAKTGGREVLVPTTDEEVFTTTNKAVYKLFTSATRKLTNIQG